MTDSDADAKSALAALARLHCRRRASKLADNELRSQLAALPAWSLNGDRIEKTFSFGNYYETIAFVNAVAWIAHGEDHHPDLAVGYNRCAVAYSTHDAGGVTQNDCICAAKVEQLRSA